GRRTGPESQPFQDAALLLAEGVGNFEVHLPLSGSMCSWHTRSTCATLSRRMGPRVRVIGARTQSVAVKPPGFAPDFGKAAPQRAKLVASHFRRTALAHSLRARVVKKATARSNRTPLPIFEQE